MKDLTKRKYFDITDGGFSAVLFVVLQYLLIFIMLSLPRSVRANSAVLTVLNVVLEALFVLSVFVVCKFKQTDFVSANTFNKKINSKIVLWALGISIVCLWLFNNLTSGFLAILEKTGYVSDYSGADINSFGKWFLSIFTVCVVPAICEETLFRGAILNSFRGFNKWIGISVSAVSFMLMHGNPDQTVHQLILGFVLGFIAWETRNIWITILIHFFNNFIAISLTYFLSNQGASEVTVVPTWGQITTTLVIGALLALGGFLIIKNVTKSLKAESDKVNALPSEGQNPAEPDQNAQSYNQPTSDTLTVNSVDSAVLDSQNLSLSDSTIKNQNKSVQDKPSKTKVWLCCLCYLSFSAYFIYEWVSVLLAGFGL